MLALLGQYTMLAQTQSPPVASYDSQNSVMRFDWQSNTNRTFFPQVSTDLNLWNYAGALHFGTGAHFGMIQSDASKTFLRLRYSDLPVASEAEAGTADFDLDGLSNVVELENTHTDPLDPDTDHDGLPDGWEVAHSISPLDDGSINPANGPDGEFSNSEAGAPGSFAAFSTFSIVTNGSAFNAGVKGHPSATFADKDGDGIPNERDAGPLNRAIDWEIDGSLPRFIYQPLAGYNYSSQGSIMGCNDLGDVIATKALYSNGAWYPLGQLPIDTPNYLPFKIRVDGRNHDAFVKYQPQPYSVANNGRIVGVATVFLEPISEEISPNQWIEHAPASTQMAFTWDSSGATPRLLIHPNGGVIDGNGWEEFAQIASDGSFVVQRRADPTNRSNTSCFFVRYDANGGITSTPAYPLVTPAVTGPQGFQAFNIGTTNAFSWLPGATSPVSLFAESTFSTPNPRSQFYRYAEPTYVGVKPGPPGGYCVNFWEKTMIRHENQWHEAPELAGTTLITSNGLAFETKIPNAIQVWKGGQKRSLVSSVVNQSFASKYVYPKNPTSDSRLLIEYYGGGSPISAGFLLPADVVSLDRYVEVGISADSIRNLGGMQQVGIRLKSADGNEVHGLANGALSGAFIHGSENEMLSDTEIASYRNGLDPKCYNDTAQDSAIWMEGNTLKFATVFDQAGPIKIEFVSGGNVVATIDYTLTALPDFSDLINVLDTTLAEIPFQSQPPGLTLNSSGPQMAPMNLFGGLFRRNLVTKCMRSVYSTVKQHVVEGVAKLAPEAVEALKIAAIGGQGFVQGLWAGVKDDWSGLVDGVQLFGSMVTSPVETAGSFARGFKELLGLSFAQLSQIPQTLVKQFLDGATQDIAWAGPPNNFDLNIYTVTYTTGFITEKVGLAIITGGASAAAQGVLQGANFAVKFTAIISKIRGAERLLNAVSVVTDKVKALSAMKSKTFRKMTQFVENKTQVAAIRQYIEIRMRPCTP